MSTRCSAPDSSPLGAEDSFIAEEFSPYGPMLHHTEDQNQDSAFDQLDFLFSDADSFAFDDNSLSCMDMFDIDSLL